MPFAIIGEQSFLGFGQVARHQEAEERAKIFQRIFDRRTREDVAPFGDQLLDGLRGLGAGIFDVLTFVADGGAPGDQGERADIAGQSAIGSDDQIELLQIILRGDAGLAVVGEDFEARGEAASFAAPVLDQGGWADDEAWSVGGAMDAEGFHERQSLDGLT